MKMAVSIPDDLFHKVDKLARLTKQSRSRLFSDALSESARDSSHAERYGANSDYFVLLNPSARIRLCRFVRSIPNARAAPETFQLDSSSARRICSRSADSRAS